MLANLGIILSLSSGQRLGRRTAGCVHAINLATLWVRTPKSFKIFKIFRRAKHSIASPQIHNFIQFHSVDETFQHTSQTQRDRGMPAHITIAQRIIEQNATTCCFVILLVLLRRIRFRHPPATNGRCSFFSGAP